MQKQRKRIRVAHLFEGTRTTGAPTSIRKLMHQLDRERFEPIMLAAVGGEFVSLLRSDGFDVTVLGLQLGEVLNAAATTRRRSLLAWARVCLQLRRDAERLRTFLEDNHIDIVHSHHHHHHLLSALACRRRIPSVWHVRAITNPSSLRGGAARLFDFCARRYASHLIPISSAVARSLSPEARKKATVIYNGIDPSQYGKVTPAAAKKRLGFSADAVLVGALGRFCPTKGFLDLVNAAGIVASNYPAAHFLLIGACADLTPGEANYWQRCVQRIAELGLQDRFHLPGKLDRPWEFLAGLDVLVLPTVALEGLGNVVLEAHASSVPVIATDCGGPADVILEGSTGFIVPCGNSYAIADKLSLLLSDPDRIRVMGAAARRRVEEPCFSIEHTVRQVETVYCSLMGLPANVTTQRTAGAALG